MSVVAIVLNWCSEAATRACATALLAETQLDHVLIVDNASPDGSGQQLEDWTASAARLWFVQTGANLGYAGGNDVGLRRAMSRGAEWALVINPDVQPEPGLVVMLLEAAAAETERGRRVGAVCPTLLDVTNPERATYAGGRFDLKRALGAPITGLADDVAPRDVPPREVTFVHGGCVLLRCDALAEVGLFREDFFMYVEDSELSLRLNRAGWALLHQPCARARHAGDEFGDPIAWKIRLRDRNRRRLVASHYDWGQKLHFMAWFYPTRGLHALRYLMRGDTARMFAVLQGLVAR